MVSKIKIPAFIAFISSPAGRWLRSIIGLAMVAWGVSEETTTGYVVALIGIEPLAAGLFDFCLFGPLFGGYFSGKKTRIALHEQQGVPHLGSRSVSWNKA